MKQLLSLIAAHALADYPLQGDFLSKAKNRAAPIPGVPWYQALGAHAIIHGGAVAFITGRTGLGLAEAVVHAITDDLKCRGKLSFNDDAATNQDLALIDEALRIFEDAIGRGYPVLDGAERCEHGKGSWQDCIPCYDEFLDAKLDEVHALKRPTPAVKEEG